MVCKAEKEYIIEKIIVGQYIKFTAIDPDTGLEASFIGPAKNHNESYMTSMAIKKIHYVMSQEKKNL